MHTILATLGIGLLALLAVALIAACRFFSDPDNYR